MTNTLLKYRKFLPVAHAVAGLCKPPGKPVGAIVLGPNLEIRSTGYQGFPRGVNDTPGPRHLKPERWYFVAHAEENAITQAARTGTPLYGCTMIVTALFPCCACARMIIQAGIIRVVSAQLPTAQQNPRWVEEAKKSKAMFSEAGVEVLYLVRDNE